MKTKLLIIGLALACVAATVTKISFFTDKPNSTPLDTDFMLWQRNADYVNSSAAQVRGAWFTSPTFTGNGIIGGSWTVGGNIIDTGIYYGNGAGLTNVPGVNGAFVLSLNGFGTNESFYGPTTFLGTNSYGKVEIFDATGAYVAGFDTNKGGFWGYGNLSGFTNLAATSVVSGGTLGAPVIGAFTGDITTPGGSYATTLATVNANVGTFGDGTHVSQVTVNAKGLVTAAANVTITGAAPTGSAGGVLSGTYPNPGFANPDTFPGPVTVPSLTNTGNMLMKGTETNSSMGTGLVHSDSLGGRSSSLLVNGDITAGTIANASLANSTVNFSGTANQISGGGSTALGASATAFALTDPVLFPGKVRVSGFTNTANTLLQGTETNSSMAAGFVLSDSLGGRSASMSFAFRHT